MPELLIVGGLTVDRFADGGRAPGGSVMHAGLAAHAEGAGVTTLTVAGREPEAEAGVRRLRGIGPVVLQAAPASTTYLHEEVDGRRRLIYERTGAPIDPARSDELPTPDVVLMAPIADELPAAAVQALLDRVRPRLSVMLIQGWLRRLRLGEAVQPLALADVASSLWDAFADADAIVVSTEDLAEVPTDPFSQAAGLRSRIGPRPLLVVTLGERGYLLDDPAADRIQASVPRRVVQDVPLVGAGDTFGAALAVRLGAGEPAGRAAEAATERVISVLELRRSRP